MTHHSTEDIVFRLEYASMSTPELALLREAAAYITNLRKQLEESQSEDIVLMTESGEEIAVIDGDLAVDVKKMALEEFFINLFKRTILDYESQQRSD